MNKVVPIKCLMYKDRIYMCKEDLIEFIKSERVGRGKETQEVIDKICDNIESNIGIGKP